MRVHQYTTGTCSCKVISNHTYRTHNNNIKHSFDLETNTKVIKNLDKIKSQQNKNIFGKLNSDNINEKNKKREWCQKNNNTKRKEKERGKQIHEYGKKLKGKLKTNRKAENCIYFRRHYG